MTDLQSVIDQAWDRRDVIGSDTKGEVRQAVERPAALDSGEARIAEKAGGAWVVHQWLKKAVLLSFRLNPMEAISGGPAAPLVGQGAVEVRRLGRKGFRGRGLPRRARRDRPPRRLCRAGRGADAELRQHRRAGRRGTMVDTWATVGSCAQIGRNVHISGGTGIGGVLEPLQAGPVIIEDDCFIGARSEVAEGVIVEQGAVLSMGVFLGASTKIVDRASGEVIYGRVPALLGRRAGHLAGQGRRPVAGLRGDRQARRRAHPVQDQHQRAAERLTTNA